MTNVKSYQSELSADDRMDVRFETEKGQVVAFAVNYAARIDGTWHPVIRFDTAHGAPHVHRFWRDGTGPPEPWPVTRGDAMALGHLFRRAYDAVQRNWRRYRALMEEAVR